MILRRAAAGEFRISAEYSSRLAMTASLSRRSGLSAAARRGPNFCGITKSHPASCNNAWAFWPARFIADAVMSTFHIVPRCKDWRIKSRVGEASGNGFRLWALNFRLRLMTKVRLGIIGMGNIGQHHQAYLS